MKLFEWCQNEYVMKQSDMKNVIHNEEYWLLVTVISIVDQEYLINDVVLLYHLDHPIPECV